MGIGGVIAETIELVVGYRNRKRIFTVMKGISLQARRGELVALIGRNGTGKSTLLRTLVGLQPPLGGKIMLDGISLHDTGSSELPRIVSYVSTEPVAVRNIRVRDVVALGRFPYTNWIGTQTVADNEAVTAALEATGMTLLAERSIDSISDGERQRTLIACSLAQDTGLLVMDEPTAFLDLPSRYGIVNLLRSLTREKGKCVIYSTHDLDTAINEADRIWLMTEDGVSDGAPEDLMLRGILASAFESPMLSFSVNDGTFSFVRSRQGTIALEGRGKAAKLTARALARCGYTTGPDARLTIK
ncbi:ABC transporter ATP-binding protein, partial [bacterium]|nr:ABC transporter ATP-binding protein [bacterium]